MRNNLKKYLILFLIIFCGMVFGLVGKAEAVCVGPDENAVAAAIASATAGETINVCEGEATWNNTLNITKGIILLGNGIDSNGTSILWDTTADIPILNYIPANPLLNTPFRLSGFIFDTQNKHTGDVPDFNFSVSDTDARQTQIRIDHNKFKNSLKATIWVGNIYGVIDNNIFESCNRPVSAPGVGSGEAIWNNFFDFTYGGNKNVYVEDNIMTGVIRNGGGADYVQRGERMAFRYNTITVDPTYQAYWLFDSHGNYGDQGAWSAMGHEIYGNQIIATNNGAILGQRGGKAIVHHNNVTTAYDWNNGVVKEEQRDSGDLVISGGIQHVNDSYYWGNRKNETILLASPTIAQDCCTGVGSSSVVKGSDNKIYICVHGDGAGTQDPTTDANDHNWSEVTWPLPVGYSTPDWSNGGSYLESTAIPHIDCCYNGVGQDAIKKNVDWFSDSTAVNNAQQTGVGCGRIEDRPASCTTGVGYWATNQSCSDLTGMVGANPATPISGMLFKCIATNTWSTIRDGKTYTPYTYPHPLRTDCTNYPTLCDKNSTCTTLGDFTCNGYSISDLQTMISIILGTDTTTSRTQADMSTPPDGLVNISDLQLLIKKVLGIN